MPTVSVIIPTYNCESYIASTLSSILRQTYQDTEIIVVDDGSTDTTCDIVQAFSHPIRLIRQANAGVCRARNRGISEANGEFICLLDHDDFWLPGKLAMQVEAFRQHPEVGVVYGGFILWQPRLDGSYPDPESYDLPVYSNDIDPDFSGWVYHQFLLDCWMLTSSAMFRAEVFEHCGAFDESLPYSEDWDMWLRISRHYPFLALRQPATLYRQHPKQGNRVPRPIDHRTLLLTRTVREHGLCSRDGRCVDKSAFKRVLSKYHVAFGLGHLRANNKAIALRSLCKGWLTWPGNLKYMAYIPAALLGWKPSW